MVPHGTGRHPRCPKWLNTGVKGTKPLSEPLPCYPRIAEEQSNYPGWVILPYSFPCCCTWVCLGSALAYRDPFRKT